jgi:hypothetical protein
VTLWADGSPQPYVATLNDPQGAIVSNAAIVPAGSPYGGINVYNDGPSITDVIIDMDGYYAPPGSGCNGNSSPTHEYIRLGAAIIAVENPCGT